MRKCIISASFAPVSVTTPRTIKTMNKITISVVEDNLDFQQWILNTLEKSKSLDCLSHHSKGEEALKSIAKLQPDIVLMDLELENSKYSGTECILLLRLLLPNTKFIVLSAHADEGNIFTALRMGAGAYLHKEEVDDKKLVAAIKEFYAGGAAMSPGIAKRIITYHQQSTEEIQQLKSLSTREMDVLTQISRGFLYKEVADQLNIKEGTVKHHAHNIYNKLQVNNSIEALLKYYNLVRPKL